jgi:hypothetical protein
MNNESRNTESTPAEWPLKDLMTDEALTQHTLEELQVLDVAHVYRGGEKTKDVDEKAAKQEVERATMEHLVQMFNITEESDSADTAQMIRMGEFHDFVNEYLNAGKIGLLEEIFRASKLGAHELALKFDEIFVLQYFKFRSLHGQPKRKEAEKSHRGKTIGQVAEKTRKDVGRIPYGPKGPSGTFGDFEDRGHVGKRVQGGSPE